MNDLNPPQEISGFELISKSELPTSNVVSFLYQHKIHKCPFFYIQSNDPHLFFSCSFHTPPSNNSGDSHMLEHLVLSGSDKYPCRDLFSAINKRSFTTFMNAFTSKLFTSFPFSTINVQDFFNVLDVYLDSLFHPILSPIEFMSECFHVEFENNDPNKRLINTGVVYNEMLGLINSAYHRIYNKVIENLFNESPERFISGGIPECICKRTIEDIRKHHLKYYHPSNSFFYLYGNVSIEKVLSKVDGYISEFSMGNWKFNTSIFNQKRWKEPRRIEIEDAFDPMIKDKKKQFRVIVSYMTNPWNDLAAYYDLDILVFYLMNEENSPFYKAIIKSGLALKFFAEGLHSESYNTFVSFGFEGIGEFDVDKVIQTIDETLLKFYNEGFSSERFEGIIHMFELYYHELKSDMGIVYYGRHNIPFCFGIDPHISIDGDYFINTIRNHLKENPRYYQELIKTTFLQNKHKLTMIVRPVEGFIEKQINGKMNEYLSNQKNSLNQEQIDKIVNDYNVLKKYLEKEQDSIDSLPSIKKSDINVVGQYDSITKTENDVSILAIPLNKITYIHISFQIDFTHPLFNYLPLLTLVIGKVGAGDKNEEQMETFMKLNCNEVKFYITEKTDLNDIHKGCCTIAAKTYCLDRNIDSTIDIMKTILFQPHLKNKETIKSIILSRLNQLNKNHQNNGNELLSYMFQSGLTDSCALKNVINGPYLAHFMKELAEKDDWNDVCEKLEICYKEIFLRSKAKAFIHSSSVDSPAVSQVKVIVDVFNKNRNMNYDTCSPVSRQLFENHKNIFLHTESRINFTAMACTTVPYNDDRSPLFDVLSYVIKNEFLYDTVRNKIGAYGVTVVHNNQTGTFVISSYRDPNPTECLQAFKKAIEICSSSEKIDDEMIDRAIMRIFVKLDRPVSPSAKGFLEFNGKSKEIESKRRNIILKATKQQVVDIAKLLKEKDWRYGIFSNQENFNPPEGLKIIKLNELYC